MITTALRKVLPTYGYKDSSALLLQALQETKFTPDIDILEGYEWQLIFASDVLKKDHFKHNLLGEDRQYLFPAFTQKNFQYWEGSAFEQNIPMLSSDNEVIKKIVGMPPTGKIKGEVFAIRPKLFIPIDTEWQNTVQFYRERIRLVVPYRKLLWLKDRSLWPMSPEAAIEWREDNPDCATNIVHSRELTCIIRAWMYIGTPAFWDPLLTPYSYSAVEHHHSNKRRWCETYYSIRRPQLPPKL